VRLLSRYGIVSFVTPLVLGLVVVVVVVVVGRM